MAIPAEPAVMFPDVAGPEFIRSEDVATVARTILVRHADRLGAVADAIAAEDINVLWLRNDKPFDAVNDDVTHDTIGKTIKAPRLWRDVTGFDAVIWVRGYFWDQFDERQQAALLFHELLHLEVTFDRKGRPKLAIAPHSIEEHAAVVRYYGDWLPDIATIVKAAGLYAADGGTPGPTDITARRNGHVDVAALSRQALEAVADAANRGELDGDDYTVRVERPGES